MRRLTVLILLSLTSCETMVDVDIPLEKQDVTVNSFFNPDSLWSVQLSLNRHVLDSRPFAEINDAEVIVYEGDDAVDTLANVGSGVFRSDSKKPGKEGTYSIHVRVPGHDELFGTSSIPLPASMTAIEVYESGNTMIRVKIQDQGGVKNYYQIYAEIESDFYDNNTRQVITDSQRTWLTSEHPAIQNDDGSPTGSILFTDVFFDGSEVELTLQTSGGGFSYHGSVHVVVRSLSEDGYNYLTTSDLNQENSGDPFAQPINVYNNIENGFGIFAGYSASMYTAGAATPVITSIDPPTGNAGDHIVITGENFLSGPAQPTVSFQGSAHPIPAQIVTAIDSQIEVIVPAEAITGKILVRSGRLVLSGEEFVVE